MQRLRRARSVPSVFVVVSFIESEPARTMGVQITLDTSNLDPGKYGSRFALAGRVFDGSLASPNPVIPPCRFADQRGLGIGIDGAIKQGA